ncbi:tRNA lysidine(34) synthetase TilS [Lapillicoccus jejuensis]|uniref:tRNA(Ile)-lysidine synthase n=1 Tax=Lapillicoccus jejuensis TaxID=402171 RepID=A0A542DXW8_9MICO|nr:tRNA lysidine(34) synthetase TilS [Lapillicoccus jejuensis]TQJ07774.1 tRNA(Ile)-lysidine synthase [Lapillicoccus jejuensis]
MSGPAPAVAATRVAVRGELGLLPVGGTVVVGCSGGPDSLALAAAVAFEAGKAQRPAVGVVVDHGLQPGSAQVAERAAADCRALGLAHVEVVRVTVERAAGGLEEAARMARYAALEDAAERHAACAILVGHTRDDQAEQVLLGLARGSGSRSLSGMPRRRGRLVRPFIGVTRAETEAACAAYGVVPWQDPHNEDTSFTRVRARALLGELERELGPGVKAALARSAEMIREDADHLDDEAAALRAGLGRGPWLVAQLAAVPRALRTRLWRLLAVEAGSPPGQLSMAHVESLDALLTSWHGQGPLQLPGHVRASRSGDCVSVEALVPVE